MTEIILSVLFINTEKDLAICERIYKKTILNSTPGKPAEFEVGKVIVTQTIHTSDLFDETFKCTQENVWLATREQFDERFNVVDDENKTEIFALITKK